MTYDLILRHSGIFIVISAFIGFFGGWIVSIYNAKRQQVLMRKNLASAFYGEVRGLINLVRKRQYVAKLRELRGVIEVGEGFDSIDVPISANYFKIYESNLENIGIFTHPVPSRITRFYILAATLAEDSKKLCSEDFKKLQKEQQIHHITEMRSSLGHCLKVGKKVKQMLEKEIHG